MNLRADLSITVLAVWAVMDSGVVVPLVAVAPNIMIAAGTVGALPFEVWMYKRNGEAQVQLLALETLQRYLDLAAS